MRIDTRRNATESVDVSESDKTYRKLVERVKTRWKGTLSVFFC